MVLVLRRALSVGSLLALLSGACAGPSGTVGDAALSADSADVVRRADAGGDAAVDPVDT